MVEEKWEKDTLCDKVSYYRFTEASVVSNKKERKEERKRREERERKRNERKGEGRREKRKIQDGGSHETYLWGLCFECLAFTLEKASLFSTSLLSCVGCAPVGYSWWMKNYKGRKHDSARTWNNDGRKKNRLEMFQAGGKSPLCQPFDSAKWEWNASELLRQSDQGSERRTTISAGFKRVY